MLMARFSNCIISILNLCTLFIGISTLLAGLSLSKRHDMKCYNLVYESYILGGILLTTMSTLGLCGACCRSVFLMWLYLFLLSLVILCTSFGVVFGLAVMSKGPTVLQDSPRIYELGEFSEWLQDNVVGAASWSKFQSCLMEIDVCRDVELGKTSTPLEMGCCMPPPHCGYEHQNGTNEWRAPKTGLACQGGDCSSWISSKPDGLCYNCETCKAGFLAHLRLGWKDQLRTDLFILFALTVIFAIGCHAFRDNRVHAVQKYVDGLA